MIETGLIKVVVDALLKALSNARHYRLQSKASVALSEAIRELLLINPNEDRVAAKLAVVRAAGIIESDLFLAEKMLATVKPATKKPAAKKTMAKKSAAKKPMAKKPAAKKMMVR